MEGHLHLDGVARNGGLREAAGESKAVTRPPGLSEHQSRPDPPRRYRAGTPGGCPVTGAVWMQTALIEHRFTAVCLQNAVVGSPDDSVEESGDVGL